MPANCDDFLKSLHNNQVEAFDKTLSEEIDTSLRASIVQTVADLGTCIEKIAERPEHEVFELSLKEYQHALNAVCHGNYRQAFSSLRLALELWLAAISFSVAEKDLRAWRARRQDIVWSKLIDENNGVLSKSLVSLFSPEVEQHATTFRVICEKVYRECSEYVHGNHHTHALLPQDISFDQATFRDWCTKSDTFKLVCLFCYTYRYCELVKGNGLANIGQPIGDALGHIVEIRSLGE